MHCGQLQIQVLAAQPSSSGPVSSSKPAGWDRRSWMTAEQNVQENEQVLTFFSGVREKSKCPSTERNRMRLILHATPMIVQVFWGRQEKFRQTRLH